MKKIREFIVNHSLLIVIVTLIGMVPMLIGYINTRINYDILVYLPKDIDTMKGQDILSEDFGLGGYAFVMVDNMSNYDTLELEKKYRNIDGVNKVFSMSDVLDTTISYDVLPDEVKDKLYRDGTSVILVTFENGSSDEVTLNALSDMREITDGNISSMSAMVLDTMNLSNKEIVVYIALAVVFCLIILTICTDSYFIPILLLSNIGVAILYNMGSNIIFGNISYITKAIAAVLQLGVTTDFSIFLYHKYEFYKKKTRDKKVAMSNAIKETFVSVIGSSLTTVIGFLSLCAMDLTLGTDIGLVMAKGVIWGVISTLTLFPSLLLVFDGVIDKTAHRVLLPKFERVQDFVVKRYKLILVIFVVLMVPALIGNGNYEVYYKLDKSLPETLDFNVANKELADKFGIVSPEIIILDKGVKSSDIEELSTKLKSVDGIDMVASGAEVMESGLYSAILPSDVRKILDNDKYQLMIINSTYEIASDELNNQVEEVNNIVHKYDRDAIVAGEGALMRDLVTIADHDFNMVNYTSILFIFVVMVFVLKSIGLPIILICAIEFAIFTNMAISYYTGTALPFIASIVVGTIQLGATIDYAILMSTKYLEERDKNDKMVSIRNTLRSSVPSIVTSALCFFGATISVYLYTKIDMIGSICNLLSRGAIISMLVVTLILPALLIVFDKFIMKTTRRR